MVQIILKRKLFLQIFGWLVVIVAAIPFAAFASQVVLPSDAELVDRSDRIGVGTLTAVREEHDAANRPLGTVSITEWLKGAPPGSGPEEVTVALDGLMGRPAPGTFDPIPPDVPIGKAGVFFLRHIAASGNYALTHAFVGFRPVEERENVFAMLDVLSRPKEFIDSPDADTRLSAVYMLARQAGPGDGPFLKQLLRAPDRQVALTLLQTLNADALEFQDLYILNNEVLENPSQEIRIELMRWLSQGSNRSLSWENWLKLMGDADNSVRSQAVHLKQGAHNPGYVSALITAMRNPSSHNGLGPVDSLSYSLSRITGEYHGVFEIGPNWNSATSNGSLSEAQLVDAWDSWWQRVVEAAVDATGKTLENSAVRFAYQYDLDHDLLFLAGLLESADTALANKIHARLTALTGHQIENPTAEAWLAWLDYRRLHSMEWDPQGRRYISRSESK